MEGASFFAHELRSYKHQLTLELKQSNYILIDEAPDYKLRVRSVNSEIPRGHPGASR